MIPKRGLLAMALALLLHGLAFALLMLPPGSADQLPPGLGIGLAAGSGLLPDLEARPPAAPAPPPLAGTSLPASAAPPRASETGGGLGGGQSYLGRVRAHLHAQRRSLPLELNLRGTAQVRFEVDGQGQVSGLQLARSSGDAELDRQALALVARAAPLPAPPAGQARRLVVPLEFSVE